MKLAKTIKNEFLSLAKTFSYNVTYYRMLMLSEVFENLLNSPLIFSYFICSDFFFFLIFHNAVMIYNTRNWSNDTTESEKGGKDMF